MLFLLVYSPLVLVPTYTDWLMAGGDLSQHYLGWVGYRNSGWTFPIGLTDSLAYPSQTSVIFTDSIPLLAVPFKLLSPLLPERFQYFGLWGISCFILQAMITVRILREHINSPAFLLASSALAVLSPVMLGRMFAHTALAGHWIILLAAEPLLAKERFAGRRLLQRSCLLAALSASVHIYFLPMCGILLLAACQRDAFASELKEGLRSSLNLLAFVAVAAVVIFLLGGFSPNATAESDGLGYYSLNLNALFNPQGYSAFLKDKPVATSGQYEGCAYLGAGCLLIVFAAVVAGLSSGSPVHLIKRYWKRALPVVLVAAFALVLSLSPTVTFNERVLFTVPIPSFISHLWSVFRSTGRFGWVVVYLIIFSSLIVISKVGTGRLAAVLVSACLLFQVYDLHFILANTHGRFSEKVEYANVLDGDVFWDASTATGDRKHLILVGDYDLPDLYMFTDWALRHDMTLNTFYFARPPADIDANTKRALDNPSKDNLYVFNRNDAQAYQNLDLNLYLIDDYAVGSVDPIDGFVSID